MIACPEARQICPSLRREIKNLIYITNMLDKSDALKK
jgi:hypothetical protein